MSSFADEWFALFGEEVPVDDPFVYHPFTSSFHDHLVIDLTTEPNDGQTAVEDDLQLFEQLDIHENTRNLRLVQQDGQPTNADDLQIFEQLEISETTQKRVFVQQDETEEENRLNHEKHFPHIYRTEVCITSQIAAFQKDLLLKPSLAKEICRMQAARPRLLASFQISSSDRSMA